MNADDQQVGTMLGGDSEDLAVGLAGGEHGIHGHRRADVIGDRIREAGAAFFLGERDVLPNGTWPSQHRLVYLSWEIRGQLDHVNHGELRIGLLSK